MNIGRIIAEQRKEREVFMKYTSAEAGKLVKKLEDRVRDLLSMESKAAFFRVASGEDAESLRPDYNFNKTQAELEHLREQIRTVKHAINVFNTTHTLPGFDNLTIDQALVYIPQLSNRKETLRQMAAHLPKERVEDSNRYGSRMAFIDYELTNYDAADAGAAYNRTSETLAKLQLALDTVNTTETMDIEVDDIMQGNAD